jgi:hypothetical protein
MDHWRCADPTAQTHPESLRPVADRLPKATQGADRARAFERIPWPHGPEDEPLARTDLNLLRPTIADATRQMTRREQMRERVALKKSDRGERRDAWPALIPADYLKLSRSERLSLHSKNRDFHHASIGRPRPGSATRFR